MNRPLKARFIIGLMIFFLIMGGLLFLDLTNQGLIWRFVWSQTGEENLTGQLQGLIELPGNLIRQPANIAPLSPIDNNVQIPYGINVFLNEEVEEAKIREQLRMIQAAGLVWLRQEFPWEDIEVDGRGHFTDSRNDINGDGLLDENDAIDAWLKYDRIVDLVEEYGLQMYVRLSNPPKWSRASNPDTVGGQLAPPDDLQDYINYAVAVASRYQGRIHYYQIWNEPNIYPEWGENFADPVAYTEMLCRTYTALKEVDPAIQVISGALAPTISLDGFYGYNDLIYLQTMYANGAGDCFDILAAQGYGLFSGPTDQRLRVTSVNVARHVYYRDIMVKNGDSHKPIWLSELAWNAVLDAERPAEEIADYERFGTVTNEQAARYVTLTYQRAQEEWPWIGNISYWFFTRPHPFEDNQSWFYFRMVAPDYSPEKPTYTPLPVYEAVKAYREGQVATLYQGHHQAEHWAITGDGQLIDDAQAEFGQALQAQSLQFKASGSGLRLLFKGNLSVQQDDKNPHLYQSENWTFVKVGEDSYGLETHNYHLQGDFILDAVLVINRSFWQLLPVIVTGLALAIFAAFVILHALYKRWG